MLIWFTSMWNINRLIGKVKVQFSNVAMQSMIACAYQGVKPILLGLRSLFLNQAYSTSWGSKFSFNCIVNFNLQIIQSMNKPWYSTLSYIY